MPWFVSTNQLLQLPVRDTPIAVNLSPEGPPVPVRAGPSEWRSAGRARPNGVQPGGLEFE